MCRLCEDCSHARCSRGQCRGVMDCDPDEYWCDADEDFYYYADDTEIAQELYYEFIEEYMKQGHTQEEAEEAAEDMEFEADCPSYSCYEPDDYYDEDPDAYDRWRDEQLEAEWEHDNGN